MKKNLTLAASLLVNVLLLLLLFRGCGDGNCPEETVREKIVIQRVDENKALPFIVKRIPVPGNTITLRDTFWNYIPTGDSAITFIDSCGDVIVYRDSFYHADSFKLVVMDTVQHNRLQGREIRFTDLSPTIIHTIEKVTPLKERWRLYAGAFGGYSKPYNGSTANWTVGPSLLLTIPQGVGITYGFDAKNNGHLLGLYYKIKLKK